MEINDHKAENIMHIAIPKSLETGSAEINPNITPEPDENREPSASKYRKQANTNMIIDFSNEGTEDVYNGIDSKGARKTLPKELWRIAQRKFYFLDNAKNLNDLKTPPSNHLEALKGDRRGQHSIRINLQYRICFIWTENGPGRVEITDYH